MELHHTEHEYCRVMSLLPTDLRSAGLATPPRGHFQQDIFYYPAKLPLSGGVGARYCCVIGSLRRRQAVLIMQVIRPCNIS